MNRKLRNALIRVLRELERREAESDWQGAHLCVLIHDYGDSEASEAVDLLSRVYEEDSYAWRDNVSWWPTVKRDKQAHYAERALALGFLIAGMDVV